MGVRRASVAEVDEIERLIAAATKKMEEESIAQWDDIYPNRQVIAADIEENSLYVYSDGGVIKGAITLNEFQDKEYADLRWIYPNERPLVVHRLCVHPDYQGHGIAKMLMKFAEYYALENCYGTIRLDCFTLNPFSNRLYAGLKYVNVGKVTFRKGEFYCYEKLINR